MTPETKRSLSVEDQEVADLTRDSTREDVIRAIDSAFDKSCIQLLGLNWPRRIPPDWIDVVRSWPEVPTEIKLSGRVHLHNYDDLVFAAGQHGYGLGTFEEEED